MDSQTEQWNIELISLSAEEGLSHKIKCTFFTSLMSRQVFQGVTFNMFGGYTPIIKQTFSPTCLYDQLLRRYLSDDIHA